MSHLLPLSRVARLVGQPRSTIQRMIHDGELDTFDGMVDMNELLRVFPDVRWEDDGEFRRVEEIKEKAFARRVYERALPGKEVLAERLHELGREFAAAKSLLLHYDRVHRFLDDKLDDLAERAGVDAVATLRHWLRTELEAAPDEAARAVALLAQESVMRIMSATVTVRPSGHEFFVEGNDTILEAALRAGIPLNYGCSNGNCGECRARLLSGQVSKSHPLDYVLKESEKADGVILMCSYTAVSDVVVEAGVAGAEDIPVQRVQTRVKAVERLNEHMVALRLTTPRSRRLRFLAGQHVTASIGGDAGEYHVASCPCDDRQLTLHVRRDNRPFARRVFEDLRKEDTVDIEGPGGRFVFSLESRRSPVFIAWEDGFAPIKSLIEHAMSLEISEAMHLYWIAAAVDAGGADHYRDNLCRSWADAYDNFFYTPLSADDGLATLVERVLAAHANLSRVDLYVAAPRPLLDAIREAALARGLALRGWHGEVIEPFPGAPATG
jgi:CDP-4-dehydro-6-deoxyglucose reductase